jgi:hypothetical protein
MEYKVIVKKVGGLTRKVDNAAEELMRDVNDHIARGWEPAGGIAIGVAGTAPYLLQAVIRRR